MLAIFSAPRSFSPWTMGLTAGRSPGAAELGGIALIAAPLNRRTLYPRYFMVAPHDSGGRRHRRPLPSSRPEMTVPIRARSLPGNRARGGEGKSLAVTVDLGCDRINKKK